MTQLEAVSIANIRIRVTEIRKQLEWSAAEYADEISGLIEIEEDLLGLERAGREHAVRTDRRNKPTTWEIDCEAFDQLRQQHAEMLEALEAVRERLRGMQEDPLLDKVHTAIQKARGQS